MAIVDLSDRLDSLVRGIDIELVKCQVAAEALRQTNSAKHPYSACRLATESLPSHLCKLDLSLTCSEMKSNHRLYRCSRQLAPILWAYGIFKQMLDSPKILISRLSTMMWLKKLAGQSWTISNLKRTKPNHAPSLTPYFTFNRPP